MRRQRITIDADSIASFATAIQHGVTTTRLLAKWAGFPLLDDGTLVFQPERLYVSQSIGVGQEAYAEDLVPSELARLFATNIIANPYDYPREIEVWTYRLGITQEGVITTRDRLRHMVVVSPNC